MLMWYHMQDVTPRVVHFVVTLALNLILVLTWVL